MELSQMREFVTAGMIDDRQHHVAVDFLLLITRMRVHGMNETVCRMYNI